jgi:hypothetical protein
MTIMTKDLIKIDEKWYIDPFFEGNGNCFLYYEDALSSLPGWSVRFEINSREFNFNFPHMDIIEPPAKILTLFKLFALNRAFKGGK